MNTQEQVGCVSATIVIYTYVSQEYHACISRRSDIEPEWAVPCVQAEECTRIRHGTVMNLHQRLTQERKLLNKCVIFVFFVHKNILVASWHYNWTTNVTWTILMMPLLPFWALNVSVALLSMQGQKALGFHPKYLNLCSEDERRSYWFETTRWCVINDIFGYTIPLNRWFW